VGRDAQSATGPINEALAAAAAALESQRDGKVVTQEIIDASRGLTEATAHLGYLHGLTAAAFQSLLARVTAEQRLNRRDEVSDSTD
jgi:hypothetical protein